VTPTGSLLLMRRVRPGTAPYWVVVGGGVEPTDASHQDTLRREVREEVGGDAEILHLLHTLDSDGERQHFYVATIASWDFAARTGPEFTRPDRSEYALDEIAPTAQARDEINLLPTAFAAVLREALVRGDLPGPPDQPASTDGTPPDPPHRATP
jgi:8-oxo-dGTP pyrophosphatase MutT (NUDIX family)